MEGADLWERAPAISFRQLKLFECVGRLESVRRGSEECNLSQPAVTQALGKLEQQIGSTLLDRRASGSYLTEAGRIFYLRVQRFFAQIEEALLGMGGGGPEMARITAGRVTRAQVRSLLAIIEFGSFAKAAQQLGLTQASLQRAGRDLEGNLRKSIFHRTSTGVMIVPDGVEFGRRTKLAMQEIEWGIRELEIARGAQQSRVVLGTLPYGGSMLLASVLGEFTMRHPAVDVRVLTENAAEMIRRLRFGDVDLVIGIVQETTDADVVNEVLLETRFRVVGREGHPLIGRGDVTIADLADQDWIVGLQGASRRACFDALFEGRRKPHVQIETSTMPVIRHLVMGSDRLTLMTSYELRHETGALAAIPFGPIAPKPSVGVTMRQNWLPTPVHRDFIDLLRKTLQAEPQGD